MRLTFPECRKDDAGIHVPEFIRVLELLCLLADLKKPMNESSRKPSGYPEGLPGDNLKGLCNPIVDDGETTRPESEVKARRAIKRAP